MKTRMFVPIAAMLLLVSGGCSLHQLFSAEGPMADIHALPQPPQGKALLVIYRPASFLAAARSLDMWVDEAPVGELPNAGAYYWLVDPGRFVVWTDYSSIGWGGVRHEVSDIAEVGKTYFIRVGFRDDFKPDIIMGVRAEIWLELALKEEDVALSGLATCHILPGSFGFPEPLPETSKP